MCLTCVKALACVEVMRSNLGSMDISPGLSYPFRTCVQFGHAVYTCGHVLDTSKKCPILFIYLFIFLNYGHVWTGGRDTAGHLEDTAWSNINIFQGQNVIFLN